MLILAIESNSYILSYNFWGIVLLLLIIGLIVAGILLHQPILWISGIVILLAIIFWATLIFLQATKALGKSLGSIIRKFIFQKNKN